MHETEVDGVPVLWVDSPGTLTATLVFGVGDRDETFRTIGVTHLVEHLALSTLPRVHYEHNAEVGLESTEFYASGRPEHIVEFVHTVCATLADPPLDLIEKEAGVLTAEDGQSAHPTAAALLNRRFGANDLGLTYWEGPGYDRLTDEHVTEHIRRFFTRANVVLTLTGPPPDGLRLPLPDGERPVRGTPPIVSGSGPSWAPDSSSPATGLALLGPRGAASAIVAVDVLRERLRHTARREHGISYGVDHLGVDLDVDRSDRLIWLDARAGQEAQSTAILWQTAVDLAESGPTAAELAFEAEDRRYFAEDSAGVEAELWRAAYDRLMGFPNRTAAALAAEIDALTPAEVAASLTESLRTALLTVPEDVEPDLGLPRGSCPRPATAPRGREFRPSRIARLVDRESRAARLVLGPGSVTIVDDDGTHHVEFADVVGMQVDEDGRVVYGRKGCVVPVRRSTFGNVQPVIDVLDRVVPPELHYAPSAFATID